MVFIELVVSIVKFLIQFMGILISTINKGYLFFFSPVSMYWAHSMCKVMCSVLKIKNWIEAFLLWQSLPVSHYPVSMVFLRLFISCHWKLNSEDHIIPHLHDGDIRFSPSVLCLILYCFVLFFLHKLLKCQSLG